MRKVGDRAISFKDELDEMTPLLTARSRGICEICGYKQAVHRHHRLRRGQGGKNELANLLHLCSTCHDSVHAHPSRSYEDGTLLRRTP